MSEIRVDTISEKTSANGVAVDGVTIKDGVFEATGDTAAGDNAAMGYTAAEGLILTGQGSTNDVTIKNDADADVIEIPTGTINVTMAGTLGVTGIVSGAGFTAGSAVLAEAELELLDGLTAGTAIASKVVTTDANIDSTGMRNLTISGEIDAATGDFSGAVDIAGALVTHADFTLTGASTGAVWDSSNNSLDFADSTQLRFGAGADLKIFHDGSDSHIVDSGTGNLKIAASAVQIMNAAGNENILLGTADGAVTIFNNNIAMYNTSATENVFNEASNDINFRVESNGNANMFNVQGADRVGIAGVADLGIGLHIREADSGASVANYADALVIEGAGDSGMTICSGASSDGSINFADSGANDIGRLIYNHSQNRMEFHSNGGEKARITSGGFSKFSSTGAYKVSQQFHEFTNSSGSQQVLYCRHLDDTDPFGIEVRFDAAAPDDNTRWFLNCSDTGATRFKVFSDGDVVNHDNAYGAVSDERIKQNIVDANSQWNDIKAVKVRNYKKKDDIRQYGDNASTQIGVVAQELEAVSPKLIRHSNPSPSDILSSSEFGTLYADGDDIPEGKEIGDVKTITAQVKSVNYSILYMKAIKALQEAMTKIEDLQARVTTLEG